MALRVGRAPLWDRRRREGKNRTTGKNVSETLNSDLGKNADPPFSRILHAFLYSCCLSGPTSLDSFE